MPKTVKSKSKSCRKALSNISNRPNLPSQNKTLGKQTQSNDSKISDDSTLDRLHAAHASLAGLLHQIDGLVTRAYKLNLTHKLGVCEIEDFIKVLSTTHLTLQGWLPKFEQAVDCSSVAVEKQMLSSSSIVSSSVLNDENLFPLDGLRKSLSPSPLVSWPLGINYDCGRELFALTPLPKSRTSADFKGFSPSKQAECGDECELACVLRTPLHSRHLNKTPKQVEDVTPHQPRAVILHGEAVTPKQAEVMTPQIPQSLVSKYSQIFRGSTSHFAREDPSKNCATPGLEISPPKTCLLMRPISKTLQQEQDASFQTTPPMTVNFRKFDESPSSDDLDSQIPRSLRIKYPDLFKRVEHDCLPIKPSVQMSPHLVISPPKSCVLMIPSSEVLSNVQDGCDSRKLCERDKFSSLSGSPFSLSRSADCPEHGKNGALIEQIKPVEDSLMAKHPDFFCQALTVPTLSSKMKQTQEGSKESPELCETCSSIEVHKVKNDLSYMPTQLENPGFAFPTYAMAECTPASKIGRKDFQNTKQGGKQPGEQTLRRELWSKLKAESADAYPKPSKDFLFKLQESSFEENSCTNDALNVSSLAKSFSSKKEVIPEQRSILLPRSATRVSVTEGVQRLNTRDRLQKTGDASVVESMKRLQVGRLSKIDSTTKNSRLQQKTKQASSDNCHFALLHTSERGGYS